MRLGPENSFCSTPDLDKNGLSEPCNDLLAKNFPSAAFNFQGENSVLPTFQNYEWPSLVSPV